MGFAAGFADNTADVETEFTFGCFNKTLVVSMNRQTTGMVAGTLKLMELKICNKRIIKSWR